LNPLHRIKVPIPDDVPVDTERRSGVAVAQLPLRYGGASGIHKHTCQAVTESMKADAAAFPVNA